MGTVADRSTVARAVVAIALQSGKTVAQPFEPPKSRSRTAQHRSNCSEINVFRCGTILEVRPSELPAMSVVASETSPLNCRWITWNGNLPICTRPPGRSRRVTEAECAICVYWEEEGARTHQTHRAAGIAPHPRPPVPINADPLNSELCPRCGSNDVVLLQRDALVQSFSCSICHQRWLATRPWPLLRDTRSHL